MKKRFSNYLKNKFVIAGLIVVALIAIFVLYRKSNAAPNFDFVEAKVGNVVETVGVTGVISSNNKADLAFEKSGVLSRVYVKVGDSVKRGSVIAVLSGGNERASLAAAEATLADMQRSLTPEELEVQRTALVSAEASFEIEKQDALNAVNESLVKAQGALSNYTDQFFDYPQSVNPTIILPTESQLQEYNINFERVVVSDTITKWSAEISTANASNANDLILKSRAHLSKIRNFMKNLSLIVNRLNPGNAGLTQAQVDAYITAMNSGLTALDSAISTVESARASLTSSENSLNQAKSSYNLKLAGNSLESISVQVAKVTAARAQVNEGVIVSPIDGVITKADPAEGEFVSAGKTVFAVQNSNFKIEANVPEADIAKISLDNMASSTLDAYGSEIDFPARVVAVNPAETVIEGVSTYKIKLEFDNADNRIRSGMTANLTIFTRKAADVIVIPYRAVVNDDGAKSVRKVKPDGKSYENVPVTLGLKGSDGNIQIISGINAGDNVVTYIKQ